MSHPLVGKLYVSAYQAGDIGSPLPQCLVRSLFAGVTALCRCFLGKRALWDVGCKAAISCWYCHFPQLQLLPLHSNSREQLPCNNGCRCCC